MLSLCRSLFCELLKHDLFVCAFVIGYVLFAYFEEADSGTSRKDFHLNFYRNLRDVRIIAVLHVR